MLEKFYNLKINRRLFNYTLMPQNFPAYTLWEIPWYKLGCGWRMASTKKEIGERENLRDGEGHGIMFWRMRNCRIQYHAPKNCVLVPREKAESECHLVLLPSTFPAGHIRHFSILAHSPVRRVRRHLWLSLRNLQIRNFQ